MKKVGSIIIIIIISLRLNIIIFIIIKHFTGVSISCIVTKIMILESKYLFTGLLNCDWAGLIHGGLVWILFPVPGF